MLKDKKIGFIGAGNMSRAIISGLIASEKVSRENIYASDADKGVLADIVDTFGLENVTDENDSLVKACDIIVFAVKPQILASVLEGVAEHLNQEKLIMSVAAGIKTDFFASGKGLRVVRVMPNTPSLVQAGAAAVCEGVYAEDGDIDLACEMFSAVGKAVKVTEAQMDAVTGLSGSGPAYILMLIEALSDAGVKAGLHRSDALTLASQTVYGTAKLVMESGRHPGELKDMVTSPGGTTITALHELERSGFRAAVMNAVEAACKKSRDMGK